MSSTHFSEPRTDTPVDAGRASPVYVLEAASYARGSSTVLKHVDLEIRPGEALAVRGASGAGKSTLLGLMAGLLRPTSGATYFEGTRLDTMSDAARSRVRLWRLGLVFQENALLPELTLLENITLPLRLTGRLPRGSGCPRRVREVCERLEIDHLLERLPVDVSGGEAQRAAVARSVVHEPVLVLADEPTASLDQARANSAMSLLLEIARDVSAAVVVVTHDDDVAARCDRTIRIDHGDVLASESVRSPSA